MRDDFVSFAMTCLADGFRESLPSAKREPRQPDCDLCGECGDHASFVEDEDGNLIHAFGTST